MAIMKIIKADLSEIEVPNINSITGGITQDENFLRSPRGDLIGYASWTKDTWTVATSNITKEQWYAVVNYLKAIVNNIVLINFEPLGGDLEVKLKVNWNRSWVAGVNDNYRLEIDIEMK